MIGFNFEANIIFTQRAIDRRLEFRRIKKLYMKVGNVNPNPAVDAVNLAKKGEMFITKEYADNDPSTQPPYLMDPEYYFKLSQSLPIPDSEIEPLSESELPSTHDTKKQQIIAQKTPTKQRMQDLIVSYLSTCNNQHFQRQFDFTNKRLQKVRQEIDENIKLTLEFINSINASAGKDNGRTDLEEVEHQITVPKLTNLSSWIDELE